jgi:hypothetical protein
MLASRSVIQNRRKNITGRLGIAGEGRMDVECEIGTLKRTGKMISVLKTCFPTRKKGSEEGKFGVPKQLGKNAGSARKLARQVRPPSPAKNVGGIISWGG